MVQLIDARLEIVVESGQVVLDTLQAIVDQPRRSGCVGGGVQRIVCAQVQGDLALPFEVAECGGTHEPANLVVASVDPFVRFVQYGASMAETGGRCR